MKKYLIIGIALVVCVALVFSISISDSFGYFVRTITWVQDTASNVLDIGGYVTSENLFKYKLTVGSHGLIYKNDRRYDISKYIIDNYLPYFAKNQASLYDYEVFSFKETWAFDFTYNICSYTYFDIQVGSVSVPWAELEWHQSTIYHVENSIRLQITLKRSVEGITTNVSHEIFVWIDDTGRPCYLVSSSDRIFFAYGNTYKPYTSEFDIYNWQDWLYIVDTGSMAWYIDYDTPTFSTETKEGSYYYSVTSLRSSGDVKDKFEIFIKE